MERERVRGKDDRQDGERERERVRGKDDRQDGERESERKGR